MLCLELCPARLVFAPAGVSRTRSLSTCPRCTCRVAAGHAGTRAPARPLPRGFCHRTGAGRPSRGCRSSGVNGVPLWSTVPRPVPLCGLYPRFFPFTGERCSLRSPVRLLTDIWVVCSVGGIGGKSPATIKTFPGLVAPRRQPLGTPHCGLAPGRSAPTSLPRGLIRGPSPTGTPSNWGRLVPHRVCLLTALSG